jgi:hypothetical protein
MLLASYVLVEQPASSLRVFTSSFRIGFFTTTLLHAQFKSSAGIGLLRA